MTGTKNENIGLHTKVMARPNIILKEEEDKWGILFNPETDLSFAINPVGMLLWKYMENPITIGNLFNVVCENCTGVPDEAEGEIIELIQQLLEKNLAENVHREQLN